MTERWYSFFHKDACSPTKDIQKELKLSKTGFNIEKEITDALFQNAIGIIKKKNAVEK